MDHGEWPLPDVSLSPTDLYLIRSMEWSFKKWSLNEPLTLLQSMSSGSEPPDKQYLSTVFQAFLKRFL